MLTFRGTLFFMTNIKSHIYILLLLIIPVVLLAGCGAYVSTDQIVRVQEVRGAEAELDVSEREAIRRLRSLSIQGPFGSELQYIDGETQKFTIEEYLGRFHDPVNSGDVDYTVGGSDILSIIVYDEPDLTRNNIRVSRDGTISFPFLGRVPVEGLTTSQIEELIADKLAEGQLLLDAQVAVLIDEYRSKKYQVDWLFLRNEERFYLVESDRGQELSPRIEVVDLQYMDGSMEGTTLTRRQLSKHFAKRGLVAGKGLPTALLGDWIR